MDSVRNSAGRLVLEFPARWMMVAEIKPRHLELDHAASSEMVIFIIGNGDGKEEFLVNKGLVCQYSRLFKVAFDSSLIEGQSQTYMINDIEPDHFRKFIYWLHYTPKKTQEKLFEYSISKNEFFNTLDDEPAPPNNIPVHYPPGPIPPRFPRNQHQERYRAQRPRIPNAFAQDAGVAEMASSEQSAQHLELVQLWILGDRIQSPRFQNHVMAELKTQMDPAQSTNWMRKAYKNTASGSPLRQLAIDICAYGMTATQSKEHAKEIPKEVFIDVKMELELYRSLPDHKGEHDNEYNHERIVRDYMVSETFSKSATMETWDTRNMENSGQLGD